MTGDCAFRSGLLKIHLPKIDDAKKKQIKNSTDCSLPETVLMLQEPFAYQGLQETEQM
jgi:hypothetical protein